MPGNSTNRGLITLAVMIPTLIEILDTSVANVSLTHIQGSLSAGQEEVTWVLTSYLVANAVVIPMSGWLARMMGRKRYLLGSIALFTLSSLLCGTATSLAQIIFFRIIQGIGGGGLQPMSQAILMETYPPEQRGLAMGIFGMGVVVGPILGPLLGGWLTDQYSWRWIFYINLPIGLLAFVMNRLFVSDPPYQARASKGERVDYVGLALLCLGIGSLQIVLDKGQQEDWFGSNFILILSVVAGVCLIAFVLWELDAENPVLDLTIFRNASFATGNIVMFLGFFTFFASIVLLPQFLQILMGYTAFQAGLILGPGGLVSLVLLPLAGKLTQRYDARFLLGLGILINAYGMNYMAGFNLQVDFATAALGRVILGFGMPFFFVTLSLLTLAYVPNERMNNASAIFNLLRNLGGSFGVAFVTTLVARHTQIHQNFLIEHLSIYNPSYQIRLEQMTQALAGKVGEFGDQTRMAMAMMYRSLLREASSMAFNDAFSWLSVMCAGLVFLLWIMKRPPTGAKPVAGH